jgi:hypothetical protein
MLIIPLHCLAAPETSAVAFLWYSQASRGPLLAGALPWTSSNGLQFSNSPPTAPLVQNSCAPRCFFDTIEDAIFTSSSGPLFYDILLFSGYFHMKSSLR